MGKSKKKITKDKKPKGEPSPESSEDWARWKPSSSHRHDDAASPAAPAADERDNLAAVGAKLFSKRTK